jgi:hypothetical protein
MKTPEEIAREKYGDFHTDNDIDLACRAMRVALQEVRALAKRDKKIRDTDFTDKIRALLESLDSPPPLPEE